jgi:ribonuclease HI
LSRDSEILDMLADTLDTETVKNAFSLNDESLKEVIYKASVILKRLEDTGDPDDPHFIYIDGVARGNPGPGGAGIVIKRSGKMVEGIAQFLEEVSSDQAEYNALILGLMRLVEIDAEKVEVRSDSQLVVKQVLGEDKVCDEVLEPLYKRVVELIKNFESFNIEYAAVEKNNDADIMANRAVDEFENEE